MTDTDILKLYFKRDEKAVAETGLKYGQFLLSISFNILKIREDSEECVNDTYIKAWDSIPPQRPQMFKNWLGRTVRNISINLWNKNYALKRYQGLDAIFDELEECILIQRFDLQFYGGKGADSHYKQVALFVGKRGTQTFYKALLVW